MCWFGCCQVNLSCELVTNTLSKFFSCSVTLADRAEEEKMCDHLITAARRRDGVLVKYLLPYDSFEITQRACLSVADS